MNAADRIAENLAQVRGRVADAAAISGTAAADITIVAVTKYVDVETTQMLFEAGCVDLGESRPQQLVEKATELSDPRIRWHLVGQLQRNKIRRTLPHAALIHSVDSQSTLLAIDRIGGELSITANVLLEVNTSGEQAKHGLSTDEVAPLLETAGELRHVHVQGLMCMAALSGDDDIARRNFRDLRALRDRLRASCPDSVSLDTLSMGMSGDFEVAIAEGATMVRIGSALFEGAI